MAARRHHSAAPTERLRGNEWRAFASLLPYLLEYRWRVLAALACLVAAKLANVGVPLVMKEVVGGLDPKLAVVAVPAALLAIYGILRFSTTLFGELRDLVFVRVVQRAIRRVALGVFRHLHSLSLRFHLDRQTGGMTRAIDSLLNYETVKYFGNEEFEARRYDENLTGYESAAVKQEASLGFLNIGQSLIIAAAVTALMYFAAQGVVADKFTLGDLVLVNGLLIQLYIPLNFLGMVYREIKQSLLDMDKMFRLLSENREVEDRPGAPELSAGPATVEFRGVDFHYERARQILHGVSFTIPAGNRVAVVGHSGSGKSTLARLLYRFYDVTGGAILVNGADLREARQASLRGAVC